MYRNGVLERETRVLHCAFGEICRKIEKFITVSRAETPRQPVNSGFLVSSVLPPPPAGPSAPPTPVALPPPPSAPSARLLCHPPPPPLIVLFRCRVNAVYDDDSVLCDMVGTAMAGAIPVGSVRMAFRHSRGLRLRPLCESGFHLRQPQRREGMR